MTDRRLRRPLIWALSVAASVVTVLVLQGSYPWRSLIAYGQALGFDSTRSEMLVAWLAAAVLASLAGFLTRRVWLGVIAATAVFVFGYEWSWVVQTTRHPPFVFGFPERLDAVTLWERLLTMTAVAALVSFVAAASGSAGGRLVFRSIDDIAARIVKQRPLHWGATARRVGALALLVASCGLGIRGIDPLVRYGPENLVYRADRPAGAVTTGRLVDATYFSHAMDERRHFDIYLPPGYSAGSGHRYPVLFLLHGDPGSYRDWARLGMKDILDAGIARGAIAPFITVMPDGNGRLPDFPQWANPVGGQDPIESSVLELVRLIDREYPTLANPRDRVIAGLSSGGFGAANLAARHPDLFGTAISLSGYFTAAGRVFRNDPAAIAANSPSQIVRKSAAARAVQYLLVVGGGDTFYLHSAQEFAAELDSLHVRHSLSVVPGAQHEQRVWSSGLASSLQQITPRLWHAGLG